MGDFLVYKKQNVTVLVFWSHEKEENKYRRGGSV